MEQLARLLNKVINTGYEVTQDEARDFMKKVRKPVFDIIEEPETEMLIEGLERHCIFGTNS